MSDIDERIAAAQAVLNGHYCEKRGNPPVVPRLEPGEALTFDSLTCLCGRHLWTRTWSA